MARRLDLKPGDGVILLRRVLEFAGAPVVLDDITLPAALFRGLTKARFETYRGSMYGFFETEFGVRILSAEEKLSAVSADRTSARLLGVRAGTPLLAVDRITLTYGDRPVEWRRGLCVTTRHHYFNRLG
jgi:GntR family transcriptional regulator